MMLRWKRGFSCGVTLALVVVLLACGAGRDTKGGVGDFSAEIVAQRVPVAADPSGALRWDRASYAATAGDSTFVVNNSSPVAHQFSIEGGGMMYKSPNFGTNTTNMFTVKGLPVGEYRIVCNYPGHKAAGMVARLTVR
jgi:plastocyanin